MSFKKMLGIIFVIVVVLFGSMLTTSYAWYSYEKGSTKFDVVTANDEVDLIFQRGEYINTDAAIPVKREEVDFFSDKYDFNIKVKKSIDGNEMVAKISLLDVYLDDELRKVDNILGTSPFCVELFYQGNRIGNVITGDQLLGESYEFGDVVLSDVVDNQFELRVYLLDNGENQATLMNQKFQARIDVNVISRVGVSFTSFDDVDIDVKSIKIDGKSSKSLPSSGYYDMSAVCEKGSHVTWNPIQKSLIYDKGSYFHDSCSLNFTKSNTVYYLKDVPVGSYVSYVGNMGCSGRSCYGENVNFVNDDNMGYCGDSGYHYASSGFRVLYSYDDTAYLVSAGALECVDSIDKDRLARIVLKYCNKNYVYGGSCNNDSVWGLKLEDINRVSIDGYRNDLIDNGGFYVYNDQDTFLGWDAKKRSLGMNELSFYGIRPVVRMASNVVVISGSGSYDDPYVIQK